jgi:hypothetical protein
VSSEHFIRSIMLSLIFVRCSKSPSTGGLAGTLTVDGIPLEGPHPKSAPTKSAWRLVTTPTTSKTKSNSVVAPALPPLIIPPFESRPPPPAWATWKRRMTCSPVV